MTIYAEESSNSKRYISSPFNAPITALNMIQAIKKAIAELETMPLAYPLVRDDRLAALGYHFTPVNNSVVFYIASEKDKSVNVDRILYNRRDWRSLLS